jgi:two-component system NtrC family sensor kinase
MTIARKLTLALVACIALAVMGLAIASVREELARSETELAEVEASTAHALRPAIRDVWLHDGEGRALELVQEADERLRTLDVRWVSLDPAAAPATRPRVDASKLGALANGDDVVVVDRDYERVGRIFTYVAVQGEGRAPAALEVSRSLAGNSAIRATVVRNATLVALVVAILSASVTTLLGFAFVERPLRELVASVRRVGGGDLSYRIATRRNDEIADLAREMNRMCERLEEARESEHAAAEAKLVALAQLRHADRLVTVGQLAAGLAHELGTPLNVASARAKRLMSGTLSRDEVVEKATIVHEQVDRMTRLVRQLLDFARKRELQPTEIDVVSIATRAAALLEPIARKRGISLHGPSADGAISARADSEQLTQVVTNLVMNALDASASGGTVSVAVGRDRAVPPADDGRPELACVRIDVHDEGAGIAPESMSRVFEPFFTTKRIGEGTGLGLSIAYGIAKDHGGWIDVASRVGHGSTFTVWLPEGGRE